jgi:hypothetical protein
MKQASTREGDACGAKQPKPTRWGRQQELEDSALRSRFVGLQVNLKLGQVGVEVSREGSSAQVAQ